MAPMITIRGLRLAARRSAKALQIGLKRMEAMADKRGVCEVGCCLLRSWECVFAGAGLKMKRCYGD